VVHEILPDRPRSRPTGVKLSDDRIDISGLLPDRVRLFVLGQIGHRHEHLEGVADPVGKGRELLDVRFDLVKSLFFLLLK